MNISKLKINFRRHLAAKGSHKLRKGERRERGRLACRLAGQHCPMVELPVEGTIILAFYCIGHGRDREIE